MLLCPILATAQPEYDPPVAKIIPKTDSIHGYGITDNYAWMRNIKEAEVINYLYAENAYADRIMKESSLLQKKLFEEMRSRRRESGNSLPTKRDNYYYYTRTEKDKDYAILCRKKDSLTAAEEIYLDENKLAKEFRYFMLGAASMSPNHQILAYGIDVSGDRVSRLFFKDLVNDTLLKDEIPEVLGLAWAGDNKTIFYTVPEPKTLRAHKLFRHVIGTAITEDVLVLEETNPRYQIGIHGSRSKEYLFITSSKTKSSQTWYLPYNSPQTAMQLVQAREEGYSYSVNHYQGDEFHISTNLNAKNYRFVKTPISTPGKENWVDVIPHREEVMLQSVTLFKDYMVISESENALDRIRIVSRTTGEEREIAIPEKVFTAGIGFLHEYNDNKIWYGYSSLVTPAITIEHDLATGEETILEQDTVIGYDPTHYLTNRIYAEASDGKRIPISMIYPKNMVQDGNNPMFLSSYGAYGISQDVGFNSGFLSYLERGFICAIAHIRGGSDLGTQWYEDGKLFNKMNTFTDFITCAEHLVNEKYTRPEKLAIEGYSAGGLLIGAVVNMRPDLFQCALAGAPFVDVMNTMLDASLPLTTFEYQEWGNPNVKQDYDYMRQYSPYENIKAQSYPNMLVRGGYNDSQVGVWEPAKYTAQLRAMKTDTNLLLFKTSMDGGHGLVSGRTDQWKNEAFASAFVMRSLGITENYVAVSGVVNDANGSPIPYASVYVPGTTNGTTTNENGRFTLELRQDHLHELSFQSIGYNKKAIQVHMDSRIRELEIILETNAILIKEFAVSAKAKDPAYGIIKQAIEKRKYYLDRVNAYSADIYMKGVARLNEVPEEPPKWMKKMEMPDSTDLGLIYLSESLARYHTRKPDDYKEEMFSSKSAGNSRGYSWNRASDVLMNFYENSVKLNGYSEREYMSPIASTALFYYKYKFLGTFQEDSKIINKIEVIPRRNTDPIFHGLIYIVEDEWSIHSCDLYLTKAAQIEFVDTLWVKQDYILLKEDIWMPLTLQFKYNFQLFGFAGVERSLGTFSNYQLEREFPKKFFHNEVFRIETGANEKDSSYWVDTRPILLTEEEELHYSKADSAEERRNSKEYRDSVEAKYSDRSALNKILFGPRKYSRSDSSSYRMNGLIGGVEFNTVEGLALEYSANYSSWKKERAYALSSKLRYSFAMNRLFGQASYYKLLNRMKFSGFQLHAGHYTNEINNQIDMLTNIAYTLFLEENYLKLFDNTYLHARYGQELINGLMGNFSLDFDIRKPLYNNTNFTIKDYAAKTYTSNIVDSTQLVTSNSLAFEMNFRYQIKQKYASYPERKVIYGSKYPTLYFSYRKGIPALKSNVNYDFLSLGIGDRISLKHFGVSEFDAVYGLYLNTTSMFFYDYSHFSANQTIILHNEGSSEFNMAGGDQSRRQLNNFNSMPYYDFSTKSSYVRAHYIHHFNGFWINKIPLLRKTRFQTLAGANMLITGDKRNFTELYVGIENIFYLLRIDFVSSYEVGKSLVPAIRIGIDTSRF